MKYMGPLIAIKDVEKSNRAHFSAQGPMGITLDFVMSSPSGQNKKLRSGESLCR